MDFVRNNWNKNFNRYRKFSHKANPDKPVTSLNLINRKSD